MSKAQATQESALVSGLNAEVNSIGVFDEYMYAWPERICVDTALDAQQRGAVIRTYTEVTGIERCGQQWQVSVQDNTPEHSGQAVIKAALVINAAGPWVDRVAGGGGSEQRILGVKGVNVMIRLPDAYKGHGLEAFSSKGEPFYVFPWRDYHFIGPTETVFQDHPDTVQVQEHEIDYILQEMNLLFPDLNLSRQDVHHSWCGVRPTSTLDGQTTHLPVRVSEQAHRPNILTLTGSTIMLHRHAGRLLAKAVEKRLGKRKPAPKGLLKGTQIHLDDIERIIATEHVVRLVDLIRRRLPDGLNPDLGRDRAEALSHQAAKVLAWSEQRRLDELAYFEANTQNVYRQTPPAA